MVQYIGLPAVKSSQLLLQTHRTSGCGSHALSFLDLLHLFCLTYMPSLCSESADKTLLSHMTALHAYTLTKEQKPALSEHNTVLIDAIPVSSDSNSET